MRVVLTPFVAAVLLTVAGAPVSSAGRQDATGAEPGRVVVALGAVDKQGRTVEGLRAEDLRVTLEGAEQKILSLGRETEEPLHVVLMLDASASQERTLPAQKAAAAEFVSALLRPGKDDAAVVSFTGDAKVVEGLTRDAAAVRRAVASVRFVPPPGYVSGGVLVGGRPSTDPALRAATTAIWDSLVQVCDAVLARADGGRRVVVLFTDGVDTISRTKQEKAAERLIREGAPVYSVGIGDPFGFEGVLKDDLRKLSKRTGGRAYFPKKDADLAPALEQLRRELLASYALALAPGAPKPGGKLNRLRVEVVNPELRGRGVELTYPEGLFFGPPPARH